MDFSKFLDDNFEVKDWVNNAFESQRESGTSVDQCATTMVMKLQMFIQEVNNVLEETSQQAVLNLPRVLREVEAIKQESLLLQDQMKMVKQDIKKVEQETSASMQKLLEIDTIKSRMQALSSALKEADNWTTLSADIENVFQSQDIHMITDKLAGMQQSLIMLKDVPDYDERCQRLETLKDRLEAMLSPQLIAAFNSKSTDLAQMYVKIFTDIKRLTALHQYFHKCHKNQMLQSWKTIVETNVDDTIIDWLPEFYDNLLSTWHDQMKWASQVFKEPLQLVVTMVTEVLNSMDPSISSCIDSLLQQKTDTLQILIDIKQVSERFAKSLETAIEAHTHDTTGQPYIRHLALAVYFPFRSYIKQYGQLEQKRLSNELDNINMDESDIVDSVRVIGESVSKLFQHVKQAQERCILLTDGSGFISLMTALQTYLESYCKEFHRVLVNLREKCREGITDQDEWSLFQNSLRIINTCGELILHLNELDDTLISEIIHLFGKQHLPPVSPTSPWQPNKQSSSSVNAFHDFPALFLDEEDQTKLQDLVIQLKGDLSSVLEDLKSRFYRLSETSHKLTYDIVFTLPRNQLRLFSEMEIWSSKSSGSALTADLPTFSLTPLEYITQIGQYLMTLPQHLEPYTTQDNPALVVALKHGKLPHTQKQDVSEHVADIWLESVAMGTMYLYKDEILKINDLSPHGNKQLITDISYFCNVLDDLGLHPSQEMTSLLELLKVTPDKYDNVDSTIPETLMSLVRKMRNISL